MHGPLGDQSIGLLVTFSLAGIAAFLPRSLWRVAAAVTILALPFTLWWCGYAALNGSGPGFDAAVAALETNEREALGSLTLVWSNPWFLGAATAHMFLLYFACRDALRDEALLHGRTAGIGLMASLVPLSAAAWLADLEAPAGAPHPLFGSATWASPLGSAGEILAGEIAWLSSDHPRGYHRKTVAMSGEATHDSYAPQSAPPVLAILYLGESARADGYGPQQRDRGDLSRQLADRIASGLGAWLPTTCAASDGTHLSIPLLLTATAPAPDGLDRAATNPTVLGELKGAGFSTAWLSNNEAGPDAQERGHDLYAGIFDADPGAIHAGHIRRWKSDRDMVPVVREFAGQVQRPVAVIMHSIGSHFPYDQRYPTDYFAPEPPNLGKNELNELRYSRSLEYAIRAILETAAILDATQAPAFLLYTSDHGENLPSDHNGLQIHLATRTSVEDGTVPSFVLWNKAMADSGRPARVLAELSQASMIAHADVARVFLALAQGSSDAVQPTPHPATWGRVKVGDPYGVVPCADLEP